MSKRQIVTLPNKVLRTPAAHVENGEISTAEFQKLVQDMLETMVEADGVGLAAPQVGIGKQMCVVTSKDGPLILINPKITKKSFRKIVMEEGCLSIPGVFGLVRRPKRITVEALDGTGSKISLQLEGLLARITQHEVDHLNGILFIDTVLKITKGERPTNT